MYTFTPTGFNLVRLAQPAILALGPLVRPDSGSGVEDIVRIVLGLDLAQGIIVGTIEDLLEVGLLEVTLSKQ